MKRNNPPSLRSAMNKGRVNVPGLAGAVWWPLFDKQTLSASAASSQRFFAVPKGQSSKTETDTNMELAGQLPAGQRFSISAVGIDIFPGLDIEQGSASAGTAAENAFANDVYAVLKTGRLKLTIGAKDYINHGPLNRFPSANGMDVSLASASTAAATTMAGAYARGIGMMYSPGELVLESSQNFDVTLFDLPALPSTTAGVIVVSLYGWLWRNAQ